ncbi:hypothetical protein FOMPIDRAFT_1052605 [Fomitopsis schrenkii]|uniref:F-box domain-containing protein n=1 Tax=Fomitopsis schrenkii TaxID=2126942 RepID=S8F6D8_FOMSC|nr:hypothetical protein FOMPIDRAFT_1052605 [Fomitopsis schrenkii]
MRHILVLAIPLHLSHLTSLTLSDIRISMDRHRSHLTEPHDVINLLESCTSIEMFTYMSGYSWRMRAPPEVDESRIVELRSIKRLCMCGTLSMTSGVMAHLSLPDNARIRLKVTDLEWDLDEDPRRPMLQAVLPVNATKYLPSLQHLRHVAVSASPLREVVIYAESERADLFEINLL